MILRTGERERESCLGFWQVPVHTLQGPFLGCCRFIIPSPYFKLVDWVSATCNKKCSFLLFIFWVPIWFPRDLWTLHILLLSHENSKSNKSSDKWETKGLRSGLGGFTDQLGTELGPKRWRGKESSLQVRERASTKSQKQKHIKGEAYA